MTSSVKQVAKDKFSAIQNTLPQTALMHKSIAPAINQASSLIVNRQNIHSAIEVFQWRYKTYLPIIKPLECLISPNFANSVKLLQLASSQYLKTNGKKIFQGEAQTANIIKFIKSNPHLQSYELLIKIEDIKYRLSDLHVLNFSQIVYLLREMMIGYDVLVDIFGTFNPKDDMIVVNAYDQWRIWINEESTSFTKNPEQCHIGEKEFIFQLIQIAQKHCVIGTLSKIFFSSIKQFVKSKQCTFITTFQKIKAFASLNKIYVSNKVNLTNERLKCSQLIKNNEKITSFLLTDKRRKNNSMNSSHLFQMKKVLKAEMICNKESIINDNSEQQSGLNCTDQSRKQNLCVTTTPKRHLNLNSQESASKIKPFFTHSPHNCNSLTHFTQLPKPKTSQEKLQTNSYIQIKKLLKEQESKISQQFKRSIKSPSLQKLLTHQNNGKNDKKKMMNSTIAFPQKDSIGLKFRRQKRKYSHEMFKVKSFQKTIEQYQIKISKETCLQRPFGQQLFEQYKKDSMTHKKVQKSATKIQNIADFKQISSNNSISTKAIQNSGNTSHKNKKANYKYLKVNDLKQNKPRNNQSSYHNAEVRKCNRERKDKNLTVSFEFKNRKQFNSCSPSSRENSQNNCKKKLSSLFSDSQSIRQLKGSVRIKTKDEEKYQKEYLKDVRLQLLQKFGRPVRYSIVDEEGEYSQQDNYPSRIDQLKSMQQIEEVIDDDKSYKMKEEYLDEQRPANQEENSTSYMANIISPSTNEMFKYLNKKQCQSEQNYSDRADDKINLQTFDHSMNNVILSEFDP